MQEPVGGGPDAWHMGCGCGSGVGVYQTGKLSGQSFTMRRRDFGNRQISAHVGLKLCECPSIEHEDDWYDGESESSTRMRIRRTAY